MRPTFTVMIGSAGRATLWETLASIARQDLQPGDQVTLGFDGGCVSPEAYGVLLDRILYEYPAVSLIAQVYLHTGPFSAFGIPQLNYALTHLPITGSHVTTIGDDDVFVDGAFAAMRQVIATHTPRQDTPLFTRFLAPARDRLWDRPRFKPCHISGCCMWAPRAAVGLHPMRPEATHDVVWMWDILQWTPPPVWVDYVAVIARPDDVATARGGVWTCPTCGRWGYALHAGRLDCCGALVRLAPVVVPAAPAEWQP